MAPKASLTDSDIHFTVKLTVKGTLTHDGSDADRSPTDGFIWFGKHDGMWTERKMNPSEIMKQMSRSIRNKHNMQ